MAYEVIMVYYLHMPSYFLRTFTEYLYLLLPRIAIYTTKFLNEDLYILYI